MIYFFTVYSADVCIGAGEALINSVCVDCWKLGQEVGLDLKSCVKCSDLKVFSPKTLSCEYCDLSSIFIQNQCVCDQNNGFAGANGFFCTDCWKMNQTVVSNTCQPCQPGFIFQDKQCVCDQARGFVNSSGQCINCYIQKQTVLNGKCAKCEETDPNSVQLLVRFRLFESQWRLSIQQIQIESNYSQFGYFYNCCCFDCQSCCILLFQKIKERPSGDDQQSYVVNLSSQYYQMENQKIIEIIFLN
ncbi:Hypothetical_protein [Hexamita inflata]|uniref:Hypothetical_protein n=1 Tax=Hexamita inflata TaxID=28002 RepID=A0AA86NFF3_9EUKA|nr:Hypothetical protein HINF_LOCUS5825 [Hexamita inflata]